MMNTIFRSAGQVSEKALSPLKAQPLLYRALQLVFALAAYAARIYLVNMATPGSTYSGDSVRRLLPACGASRLAAIVLAAAWR
ncbi:hypothetical protein [Alcanivorax sp. DG881]|uniref:hypothetical protein n=1 Tax=Alcanivorax sp. DG881 TaxID=236097 RepID=UPI001E49FC37|nr:hypothetical protein [Alcanivorax sp. DG881]